MCPLQKTPRVLQLLKSPPVPTARAYLPHSFPWPAVPLQARSLQSCSRHTGPFPLIGPSLPHNPSATSALTLLLSRKYRAPAFAPRTAAGLLRGVALWLQVLWWGGGRGRWLRGSCVVPGRLMDFGDLLREAERSELFTGPARATETRERLLGPLRLPCLERRPGRGSTGGAGGGQVFAQCGLCPPIPAAWQWMGGGPFPSPYPKSL